MVNFDILIKAIICHAIGDYALQSDFLANTKGRNLYHLLIHCILYCTPFYFIFGLSKQLAILFLSHIIIDLMKSRYKYINYFIDQLLHYIMVIIYLITLERMW